MRTFSREYATSLTKELTYTNCTPPDQLLNFFTLVAEVDGVNPWNEREKIGTLAAEEGAASVRRPINY